MPFSKSGTRNVCNILHQLTKGKVNSEELADAEACGAGKEFVDEGLVGLA